MIVKNVLNYLETNDMSVRDFAKKAKLRPTTIYSIINGQSENPTLEVLTKLSKAMGMTIDELTKSEKRDMDEARKLYEKMKTLNDEHKNLAYIMINAVVDEMKKIEK